jgi:hypothetical protein
MSILRLLYHMWIDMFGNFIIGIALDHVAAESLVDVGDKTQPDDQ